ncbi:hypothetical protein BY458DRAFT_492393 [Sporodiniella umbellata]|nr:hypothetical protein BY458DRAFT_492393 [Sporodiniella umbellata]
MTSSESAIIIDEDSVPKELLKSKATPRKIIFGIDVSNEMNTLINPSLDGGLKNSNYVSSTRLKTVQRFLKRYIQMNLLIGNTRDEYAIMLLKEEAEWWRTFSSDEKSVCSSLDNMGKEVCQENYKSFAMETIFKTINANVDVERCNEFVQMIVVYSRTLTVPHIDPLALNHCKIRHLANFTMDVIFLHEVHQKTQSVYNAWGNMDSKQVPGWYYEMGNVLSQDKISRSLSQLLAHPLQRGDQTKITGLV